MLRRTVKRSRNDSQTKVPSASLSKNKGISRMDFDRAVGWLVRVYEAGGTHSRFFSDGRYGGWKRALGAARKYREDYVSKHPPKKKPTRKLAPRPVHASSGILGVSETYNRSSSGKKLKCFLVTYVKRNGVRSAKRFYHHLFRSRTSALEAARRFRMEVSAYSRSAT